MLSHEIGHLQDHSTRYGLMTAWLTAPWRAAVFMFGGLLRLIVRTVPTAKAALVLVPVLLVVAGMQLAHRHVWAPLAVLTVLAAVLTLHQCDTRDDDRFRASRSRLTERRSWVAPP